MIDLMWNSDEGKYQLLLNRNESLAGSAKLFYHLHSPKQKETGRCPGGNTTGVPR